MHFAKLTLDDSGDIIITQRNKINGGAVNDQHSLRWALVKHDSVNRIRVN